MTELSSDPATVGATEVERCAGHLLLALETLIGPDSPEASQAERFDARLRFSLERVGQLRQSAGRAAGVFEPARLEVALQILDSHVIRAARFLDEIAERRLRAAAHRYRSESRIEASEGEMPPLARERAA